MAFRILIDTNVLLDYALKRDQYYENSRSVIVSCVEHKSEGFIAAHSIPDMFYIMRRDYSDEERRNILLNMLTIVDVVGLDKSKIISALKKSEFKDYEDCLQSECAEDCFADYIVTRNVKDFSKSGIKAITPTEYLTLMDTAEPKQQ